jgi:LEA14-like dessication related protein
MAFVARVAAVSLAAGLLGLVSGCSVAFKIPPSVEVRDTRVQQVDWSSTTFTVSADVTNKDPNPVTIETADYSLSVDGVRVATGSTRVRLVVGPGETMSIALPIPVQYYRLLPVVSKRPELVTPAGQIGATIDGVARGTNGLISVTSPIAGTVAIPLTKDAWSDAFPGIK